MSCGYLEWFPYEGDKTMGLNHQMASLSCALGEAFFLQRQLLLPDQICLFGLHQQRWKTTANATAGGAGVNCVPTTVLFDLEQLTHLVPVGLKGINSPLASSSTVRVGRSDPSAKVKEMHKCPSAGGPVLVRRKIDSEFWFQQCTRRKTEHASLAIALNQLVGAPAGATRPANILLRSGLFFSRPIKAAASAIRARIGGAYASVHVRRSDKLTACSPADCAKRDALTRPDGIAEALKLWLPLQSHVYIGSTEAPRFFEPLRASYRVHFAEDFSAELANITNNYALYAVETLVFFGSQMSVESYSFQSGWFVDACFPASSMRRGLDQGSRLRRRDNPAAGSLIAPPSTLGPAASRAIEIGCRDQSGILVNGVLYGPACISNAPCGRAMALVPKPRTCGQMLPERLMLSNRSARAAGGRRCAAYGVERKRAAGGMGGGKKHGGGGKKFVAAALGVAGGAASGDVKGGTASGGEEGLAGVSQVSALHAMLREKEAQISSLRAKLAAVFSLVASSGAAASAPTPDAATLAALTAGTATSAASSLEASIDHSDAPPMGGRGAAKGRGRPRRGGAG